MWDVAFAGNCIIENVCQVDSANANRKIDDCLVWKVVLIYLYRICSIVTFMGIWLEFIWDHSSSLLPCLWLLEWCWCPLLCLPCLLFQLPLPCCPCPCPWCDCFCSCCWWPCPCAFCSCWLLSCLPCHLLPPHDCSFCAGFSWCWWWASAWLWVALASFCWCLFWWPPCLLLQLCGFCSVAVYCCFWFDHFPCSVVFHCCFWPQDLLFFWCPPLLQASAFFSGAWWVVSFFHPCLTVVLLVVMV